MICFLLSPPESFSVTLNSWSSSLVFCHYLVKGDNLSSVRSWAEALYFYLVVTDCIQTIYLSGILKYSSMRSRTETMLRLIVCQIWVSTNTAGKDLNNKNKNSRTGTSREEEVIGQLSELGLWRVSVTTAISHLKIKPLDGVIFKSQTIIWFTHLVTVHQCSVSSYPQPVSKRPRRLIYVRTTSWSMSG